MNTRNFFEQLDTNLPARLVFANVDKPQETVAEKDQKQSEALRAIEAAKTEPEAIAAALKANSKTRNDIGAKIDGFKADNRGAMQRTLGDAGAGMDRLANGISEKAKAAKNSVKETYNETVADMGLTAQSFLEMIKAVGGDLALTKDAFKEMAGAVGNDLALTKDSFKEMGAAVADDLLSTKDSFMKMMAAVGQTRQWEILVGMGGKVMDAAIKYGYDLPKEAVNILIADGAELSDDTIKFFKENGKAFAEWAKTAKAEVAWALKESKRVYIDAPIAFVTETVPTLAAQWTAEQLASLAGVWAKSKEEYDQFAKLCGDKYDAVKAAVGEKVKGAKERLKYAKESTVEGFIAGIEFAKEHGYDIPKDYWKTEFPLWAENWTDNQISKAVYYFTTDLKIPVENWTAKKKQQMIAAVRAGEKAWNGFLADMEKEGEARLGRGSKEAAPIAQAAGRPEQGHGNTQSIEGGTLELPATGKVAVDGLRMRSGPGGKILASLKTGESVNFEPQSPATYQVVGDVTWRKIKDKDAWVAVKKGRQNYINS